MAYSIAPLEEGDAAPKYMRVRRALRLAVATGALAPQDALPNERNLAEQLGVSRITVRKAIGGLVEEGLLRRRQGAGTFITVPADRIEKGTSKISSFTEDMLARGLEPRSEWVSRSRGIVSPDEAINMGLSPGSAVLRFARIRYADQLAMAVEHSTIDAACLPSAEVVNGSLYKALEGSGFRPKRALQRLRAIVFDAGRAAMLDIEEGAPGLLIERRGYLLSGRLIELTVSYYRGDAYDFVAELTD